MVGISALKLAPKIAANIKSIFGKEKSINSVANNLNKKTVRVRNEFSPDTDIPAMEEKFKLINLKIKPQGKKGELRGSFDAPLEHVTTKNNINTLTNDPKIRSQYPVKVVTDTFALENIDDPFFKQLGKQYGNQTYMGEKLNRLNKTLLTRLANLNRTKVGNELGLDIPSRTMHEGKKDSSIMKVLRRTNPDIELLQTNKRYLTRGKIKRNKLL